MESIVLKYSSDIDKGLNELSNHYINTGLSSVSFSPKWINYSKCYKRDDGMGILSFKSTQKSWLGFEIVIDPSDVDVINNNVDEFWETFEAFRTKWLLENFPSISV